MPLNFKYLDPLHKIAVFCLVSVTSGDTYTHRKTPTYAYFTYVAKTKCILYEFERRKKNTFQELNDKKNKRECRNHLKPTVISQKTLDCCMDNL